MVRVAYLHDTRGTYEYAVELVLRLSSFSANEERRVQELHWCLKAATLPAICIAAAEDTQPS